MLYRLKTVKKPVVFLKPEQLKKLKETTFYMVRIQQIKDMFMFCCYTGLGYTEMVNLKKKQMTVEFDGELWINFYRQKTKKKFKLPLLPKAKAIMEQYENESEYVFTSVSNTHFMTFLK